jgi:hypothetical protein
VLLKDGSQGLLLSHGDDFVIDDAMSTPTTWTRCSTRSE